MKTRLVSLLLALSLLTGCQAANTPSPNTTMATSTTTTTTTTTSTAASTTTTEGTTTTVTAKQTTATTVTKTTRYTIRVQTTKTTKTATSATQTTKTEETTMTSTAQATTTTKQPTTTTVNPDAPLEGKTALFVGDSIAYGYATNGEGFAHHVKEAWGLGQALNGAVNGAQVSIRRGDTQQYIYNQLKTFTFWKFDYILLHGGVNDMVGVPHFDADVPLGTLSDDGNYDVNTFAGALEKEIAFALEAWPNAKVGYILNYDITDPVYRPRMSEYIEMTRKVCDKWNIPTLNLFDGKLCPSADGSKLVSISERYDTTHGPNEFMADQFHPTAMGYEVLAQYIGEFMISLG